MSNPKRFRLTPMAKILLFIIVIAMIGCGVYAGIETGFIKMPTKSEETEVVKETELKKVTETQKTTEKNVAAKATEKEEVATEKSAENAINISLDEWVGWKPIIDANKGLTTQKDSIYDKLGIQVNISIINDATQSSNALISGNLDAAGYTINRTAFLSTKFKNASKEVIMPYITNFSNGGDGIIAKSNITSVDDLVTAKIGVPQFSEAHSLVVWFVKKSDLPDDKKQEIIDNLIFFATPDDAAKAFFAGQVDVAATWEPYLTQAQNMSDSHVLFSTASSTSLIMDGILFSKEFAEKNPELVSKFIDGALQAAELYMTDTETIKGVMPMFATASAEDIIASCESAKLMTYADNMAMFKDTAKTIYADMCDIWTSIGETVDYELVNSVYDDTYITTLEDKYSALDVTQTEAKVDLANETAVQEVIDTDALLKKSASVTFTINTAKFADSASATAVLDDFIAIAKVLNGTIIEIAGNTDPNPTTDPDDVANKMLSEQRAETVKQYFVMNGISPNRIITVGNGSSNPVVDNDTDEHRAMNRRTDVSFKCVE